MRLKIILPSQDNISLLDRGDLGLILAPDSYVSPQHPVELLFEERTLTASR